MYFLVPLYFKDYKYIPLIKKILWQVYRKKCFSLKNNQITEIMKTYKYDKKIWKHAVFKNYKKTFAVSSHNIKFKIALPKSDRDPCCFINTKRKETLILWSTSFGNMRLANIHESKILIANMLISER